MFNCTIKVADVPFIIKCEDQKLETKLADFFESYQSNKNPFFSVIIQGNYINEKILENQGFPTSIEKENDQYCVKERSIKNKTLATIDTHSNKAVILLDKQMHFSRIIAAIRTTFMYFLEQQGGFLLHAASGNIKGLAHTFTGKSGAGKTTALNNLKADSVVAEDTVAISTKESIPVIFSTPFRQDKKAEACAKAIYFPKKAKSLSLEPVDIRESTSEIISNTLFSSPFTTELLDSVIDNISRFCQSIPAFNIHFEKTSDLRKVIT